MTPPDEPFDQDAPKGKGRSSGRASGRTGNGRTSQRPSGKSSAKSTGRPSGDGWDDGTGSRPARGRGGSAASARSGRTGGKGRGAPDTGAKGFIEGLPRWLLPGVGVVIVALILFTLVRSCGSSAPSNAGSCLTDLSAHLPSDSPAMYGTDLVQARKAGFDETGPLEDVGEALKATGAIPDPISDRYRFSLLTTLEEFEARTGMSPGDADCALSAADVSVLSGDFDPVAVNSSQAGGNGELAASEDILARSSNDVDPKALLEPAEDGGLASNEAMVAVLERLREDGAYSVIVQQGSGGTKAVAAGIGVGGGTDELVVPITWIFEDDDAATAGRADVVDKVNTVLRGTLSIDATDLVVDGPMVTAVLPTVEAPGLNELIARGIQLVEPPA